jgi:hypothetical protein
MKKMRAGQQVEDDGGMKAMNIFAALIIARDEATAYKKWVMYWGEGYTERGDRAWTKEVDIRYFTEDNGFCKKDIDATERLHIAQAHRLDDLHMVTVIRVA